MEAREARKAASLLHDPAPAAGRRRADHEAGRGSLRWYEPFRSARLRIALLSIAVLALVASAGMLALREVLLLRLEDRTRDSLTQGLEELRRSAATARDRIAGTPPTTTCEGRSTPTWPTTFRARRRPSRAWWGASRTARSSGDTRCLACRPA